MYSVYQKVLEEIEVLQPYLKSRIRFELHCNLYWDHSNTRGPKKQLSIRQPIELCSWDGSLTNSMYFWINQFLSLFPDLCFWERNQIPLLVVDGMMHLISIKHVTDASSHKTRNSWQAYTCTLLYPLQHIVMRQHSNSFARSQLGIHLSQNVMSNLYETQLMHAYVFEGIWRPHGPHAQEVALPADFFLICQSWQPN